MKITGLEIFHVKPRWVFLKVSTDEGIVGYGEPVVEGKARTVDAAVMELESYLLGKDPRDIEKHWQTIYRGAFYRGGPILVSALSGIEQALWDIKGKYHDMPVYQMLGGACRHRVRMYAPCGGGPPEKAAARALERKKAGFTAVKTALSAPVRNIDTPGYVRRQAERVAAIREAVGEEVDVAIDFHGRVSPAMAIRLARAMEPYDPMFIEEPCLPENVEAMGRIARATTIPIAAGERLFTRWGFRELIEKQAVAVVQPDICHAGGILEARKIAAMAEVYYSSVAPHNPLGPISLAACLQLDAVTPNFLMQEHPGMPEGWDLGCGYLKEPFEIVDGYIQVPTRPGLGIDPDEDVLSERSYPGDWDSPLLYHEDDGALADW